MRGVRDRFTDGSEIRRTSRPSATRLRLIAVVVVVLALGAVAAASAMLDPDETAGGVATTATPTRNAPSRAESTAPSPTSNTSSPRPTTTSSSDAAGPTPDPDPSPTSSSPTQRTTAARFVDAWLTVDPEKRAAQLDRWAVPALARSLKNTDPNAIPDTTRDKDRSSTAVESSEYQGRFEVYLADGGSVLVDVVGDGADGWLASSVTPTDS